jgi:hypothetical protein
MGMGHALSFLTSLWLVVTVLGAATVICLVWGGILFIGGEGLYFRRRLFRSRFFPLSNVISVRLEGEALLIESANHSPLRVWRNAFYCDRQTTLRAMSVQVHLHKNASRPSLPPSLLRGSRTSGTWLEDVKREENHRIAAIPREVLLEIVASGGTPATARLAAAARLLASYGGDNAVEVVAQAATSCTSPRLASALLRISADVNDPTLPQELDEFVDGEVSPLQQSK